MAYQSKEEQDAFLTSLEGKLRGPYSSLEISKIIQTKSLRGDLTSLEYLQNISQVLSRTDKTTYLRTIVGLLGLEPGKETDEELYRILTDAQSTENEDWVRVVAGLARGILFVEDEDGDTRESCRGEEASSLLDKTCREIVEQTRQLEKDTSETAKEEGKQSLQTADMYPLFVSYRYSLLDPQLLDSVIPEHKENPYFQCDATASILEVDDKIEKLNAEEAKDHLTTSTKKETEATGTDAKNPKPTAAVPGTSAISKKSSTKAPVRKKTSMFMPTKRPGQMAGRVGGKIPTKGTLHTRKAGAAKALLGTTRPRSIGGARAAQLGRGKKLSNAKSKMMMIDDSEMRQLTTTHKKRDDKIAKKESRDQKLLARKRRIMEAAAEKGLVVGAKVRKLEEEAKEEEAEEEEVHSPMDMVSANQGGGFMAFGGDSDDEDDDDDVAGAAAGGGSSNEEWQDILNGRSNKLSDEDRARVQQFFSNRHNPTPDQPVYKMKLHEERTTDPSTGQAMKETYYLELDYANGTSKQSKKTKRY